MHYCGEEIVQEYKSIEEKELFDSFIHREAKHLLPHGEAIRLVDTIVKVNRNGIMTQALISPNFPLLEYLGGKKVFPSYKLIEMMAQSLGCYRYIMSKVDELYNRGDMGLLVGARRLDIKRGYINIGEIVNIKIEVDAVMPEGFASYSSVAYVGSEEIVSSTVSVFSPDQEALEELKVVKHLQ